MDTKRLKLFFVLILFCTGYMNAQKRSRRPRILEMVDTDLSNSLSSELSDIARDLNDLAQRVTDVERDAQMPFPATLEYAPRTGVEIAHEARVPFCLAENPRDISDIFDDKEFGYKVKKTQCYQYCLHLEAFSDDIRSQLVLKEIRRNGDVFNIESVTETAVNRTETRRFPGTGHFCTMMNSEEGALIVVEDQFDGIAMDGSVPSKVVLTVLGRC